MTTQKVATGESRSVLGAIIVLAGAVIEASQKWQVRGETKILQRVAEGLQILQSPKETEKLFNSAPNIIIKTKPRFVVWSEALLSRAYNRPMETDPLPESFTPENTKRWQKLGASIFFSPGAAIVKNFSLPGLNYVGPRDEFYDKYLALGKSQISYNSIVVPRGWMVADCVSFVDYNNGTQVIPNEPLAPIIEPLRAKGGKEGVGRYDNTPAGSRFAITPVEWEEKVCPAWPGYLGEMENRACQPMSWAIWNYAGNVFFPHFGQFDTWTWFSNRYGEKGSDRLYGGNRDNGGLADVNYDDAGTRVDDAASRPLVSFA